MKAPIILPSFVAILIWANLVSSQGTIDANSANIPSDLNGSNFTYPWPVKLYKFTSQLESLEMAFMDVPPACTANGKTAVLLHGKNFCGATWAQTAGNLSVIGYRVIIPDQIGFCKSTKPLRYQFSLSQLALNTNNLLRALGIANATIIGHSMGGMLAARYALTYATNVTELVLVDPLGLEDWMALGVPYQSIDLNWVTENATTFQSIKTYEETTYYVNTWTEAYDVWVTMLINIYYGDQRSRFVFNLAEIDDMVLTQPVIYEFPLIEPKTLLVVGDKDNTAIGKTWSPPDVQAKLGHYNVLGKQAAAMIPNCTLIEFPDLGHAPQIEDPAAFHSALLGWLAG